MDQHRAHRAIDELVARYADYCDHARWADVVALYEPDGVFDAEAVYGRTMTGSAELLDFYENAPSALGHHPTTWYSDVEGDTASTRMKMIVLFGSGIFSVDYAWELVADGDAWRIRRQEIEVVGRLALKSAA